MFSFLATSFFILDCRNPLHRGIIIVIVASAGSIYEDVGCVASNFKTDFPFLGLFLAFGRKGKKGGFIILEFCKNTKKVSIFAPPKSPKWPQKDLVNKLSIFLRKGKWTFSNLMKLFCDNTWILQFIEILYREFLDSTFFC